MARNSEKAAHALNRWVKQKRDLETGLFFADKRPRLAEECEDLKKAEKWRHQIQREISKIIAEIQDASLGEHRIRDLNDEINKKLRERGHWENQIKKLGGPDYSSAGKSADSFGNELSGQSGYKYFGAAKDLPGVRELFEREEGTEESSRKTRKQLYKFILPDYYGWRDEEDGLLLLAEQEGEIRAQKLAIAEYEKKMEENVELKEKKMEVITQNFTNRAYVSIPNHGDIQKLILEKKKKQLLDKYSSKDLQDKVEEAKELQIT